MVSLYHVQLRLLKIPVYEDINILFFKLIHPRHFFLTSGYLESLMLYLQFSNIYKGH